MRLLLPVAALAALFLPVAAHADMFAIDFTSGTNSGMLVLTTTDTTSFGFYTVTNITGEENGNAVSMLPPNTYGVNDNAFFPTGFFLDDNGIGFSVAGHGDDNLYYDSPNATEIDRLCTDNELCTGVSPGLAASVTLVALPTPEPSSLFLLGTGILSAAGATRRRLRRT